MKKVILLTTVLGLSALGMACGEAANNTNKPNTNVAPAASPVSSPVSSPVTNANTGNTNRPVNANANKPANTNANKPK